MDKNEWLTARLDGIGASEAAAILGYDPYSSPWSVWRTKVDRVIEERDAGPLAEWGHRHEPAIAQKFDEMRLAADVLLDHRLIDPGEHEMFWGSDSPPMFCTPDRLLSRDGHVAPVEIKCAWYARCQAFGETLPIQYRIQITHQMLSLGATEAYYAVLLNGHDFRWYREVLNERFAAALIKKLAAFWQLVLDKTAPPADWRDGTRDAITRRYEPDLDATVELSDEWDELDGSRQSLLAKRDEVCRQIAAIDNRLRAELGSATCGVIPGREWCYTWRPTKTGTRTLRRSKYRSGDDEQ